MQDAAAEGDPAAFDASDAVTASRALTGAVVTSSVIVLIAAMIGALMMTKVRMMIMPIISITMPMPMGMAAGRRRLTGSSPGSERVVHTTLGPPGN